jgi:hypothetical protein
MAVAGIATLLGAPESHEVCKTCIPGELKPGGPLDANVAELPRRPGSVEVTLLSHDAPATYDPARPNLQNQSRGTEQDA